MSKLSKNKWLKLILMQFALTIVNLAQRAVCSVDESCNYLDKLAQTIVILILR